MQGFPKHIATKEDITNLLSSYKEETIKYLQRLLDERFQWVLISTHDKDETVEVVRDQKVAVYKEFDGTEKQYLFQWSKVESDGLNRIGLTVEEAVELGCEDKTIEVPNA